MQLTTILINLERSHERRAQMEARLAILNHHYVWFPAIDGKQEWKALQSSLDQTTFERRVGRGVLAGEVGCYHSHLKAWQQWIANSTDGDVLLVLEDDIVFTSWFQSSLELALKHANEWDMLKLCKIRAKQPIQQAQWQAGDGMIFSLNAYLGPATGFGAYLIHHRVAQQLLPKMLPIRSPIDRELDRVHIYDIKHFGLEPFPCIAQDNDQSTITGISFSEVKKFAWYKRLPCYGHRLATLYGKIAYLMKTGRIKP